MLRSDALGPTPVPLAYLFDVDNTLLDNDRARIARAGFTDIISGPVLVDDKPRILAAARDGWGDRVTTLHVCQGKYAHAAEHDAYPDADLTVDRIADIIDLDLSSFLKEKP